MSFLRFAWIEEPPFNFRDAAGAVLGHDADLARLVAERLGLEFKPVETTFAELLPGLRDGRWQMTTGLFVTPARATRALFTRPIWRLADGLLVGAGNPGRLTGYVSVAGTGLRLAVVAGQVQAAHALAAGVAEAQLLVASDYASAVALVRDGAAAAFASVARAHAETAAADPALEAISVPATEVAPAEGAFALSDPSLLAAVDGELARLLGGPEHRALQARYALGRA